MPRILPQSLIKEFAIEFLLRLYEGQDGFNKERGKIKFAFIDTIEKIGKIESLRTFYDLTINCASGISLATQINERQKLMGYLKDFLDNELMKEISKIWSSSLLICRKSLLQYIENLGKLAFKWNLRASWAANELFERDIAQEVQNTFDVAGITIFKEPTFEQLRELFHDEGISLPVLNYKVTPYSFFGLEENYNILIG